MYAPIGGGVLDAFSLDFPRACKNVGAYVAQLDFATSILVNPDGGPTMATLRTHPIGPAARRLDGPA